jgi:tRNA threonylcarbamoyladenosine biosynthesis protein TsaB
VPSLSQLLAQHATLLVLDASSPRVEASFWVGSRDAQSGVAPESALAPLAVAAVESEASVALPAAVARVLAAPAVSTGISQVEAIAFCDGPGSVLGIRLSAASLRAWRSVRPDLAAYAFHSLPLLAEAHPNLTIIADARRDTWHAAGAACPDGLSRVPTSALVGLGPLGTPDNFRRWSSVPENLPLTPLPFSAARLLGQAPRRDFFRLAPEPDAWMSEAPEYVAWTPRVHQAPGPR